MEFITSEQDINYLSKFCILYFYNNLLPFHEDTILILSKIEQKYKDTNIFAIDSDFFKTLCKKFNIISLPTVIIMLHSNELKKINNFMLQNNLFNIFDDIYKDNINKN